MMGLSVQRSLAATFADSAVAARMRPVATRPFSIRLSKEERLHLEREAGAQPLGTYVRARLLNDARRGKAGRLSADPALLGQLLARLGQLQLARSLSDLSAAATVGSIVMTPELERELRAASRAVREIRDMLMRALGLKPDAPS